MKLNILKRLLSIKKEGRGEPQRMEWNGSANYWQKRYLSGDNSGAGSYNRLAEFKAEVINGFVETNRIKTIVEWGCGDGNQLTYANYPSYIGFDVAKEAIRICRVKFQNDDSKQFVWCGDEGFSTDVKAELVLSLDVIYHLIEDEVFDVYMRRLFNTSQKYVCIYSCDDNDAVIGAHVKHRKFTKWIEDNCYGEWTLLSVVKNRYPYNPEEPETTSWSDFFFYVRK